MTMTFVVMGLGTVFNALANRRDPASGLTPPILKALAIAPVPVLMIVLATELPGLQRACSPSRSPAGSGSRASASRRCCRSSSRAASGSAAGLRRPGGGPRRPARGRAELHVVRRLGLEPLAGLQVRGVLGG